MSDVAYGDFGGAEVAINKTRLAKILGRSRRWVELQMREGLPSRMEGNQRMFRLSEVRTWMADRGVKAAPPRQATEPNGDPDDAPGKRRQRSGERAKADVPDSPPVPPSQGGANATAERIAELRRIISDLEGRIAELEAGDEPPAAA